MIKRQSRVCLQAIALTFAPTVKQAATRSFGAHLVVGGTPPRQDGEVGEVGEDGAENRNGEVEEVGEDGAENRDGFVHSPPTPPIVRCALLHQTRVLV